MSVKNVEKLNALLSNVFYEDIYEVKRVDSDRFYSVKSNCSREEFSTIFYIKRNSYRYVNKSIFLRLSSTDIGWVIIYRLSSDKDEIKYILDIDGSTELFLIIIKDLLEKNDTLQKELTKIEGDFYKLKINRIQMLEESKDLLREYKLNKIL